MIDLQQLIALLIAATAGIYLFARLKNWFSKSAGSCGGCTHCPPEKTERKTLYSLSGKSSARTQHPSASS